MVKWSSNGLLGMDYSTGNEMFYDEHPFLAMSEIDLCYFKIQNDIGGCSLNFRIWLIPMKKVIGLRLRCLVFGVSSDVICRFYSHTLIESLHTG